MRNAADTLIVTMIQSDLAWEDKKTNLERFEERITSNSNKMEVVLLPEMFSTAFSMNPSANAETMEGESVQWMKRVAAENNIIIAGSLIIREDEDYFNRLIWMLPNGEYGYYDKRHLFGYAGEDEHYSSGNKRLIASVKGWKVNLQVCYDLRFPVWARQVVPITADDNDPEYDLLVYVANWPEKRVHAWKTLLQARAIENQCYVVGVNRVGDDANGNHYTGDSMIVDPLGQPLIHAGDKEGVFTFVLQIDELNNVRQKLPFLKDADPFIIAG